jgi:hypothetical protein
LDPPEYLPISSSKELPRLRVLKQGDIDLSANEIPEINHLWWFAKKDSVIAASMKSTGELIELDLDRCVSLFGDDPGATNEHEFIPTAYKRYLEARSMYNKQVGDLLKTNNESKGDQDDELISYSEKRVRWFNVERIQLVRNNIQTFIPAVGISSQLEVLGGSSISADLVQKMTKRSELLIILTWNKKTIKLNVSAPTVIIEFKTTTASNSNEDVHRLSYLYSMMEKTQKFKKGGLFSLWKRDENECFEMLCLRDIPTLQFSVRVAPISSTMLNSIDSSKADKIMEPGYNHFEDLSIGSPIVQIYQRTGHIGTFASWNSLTKFQPNNEKILSRVEWSVLKSGESTSTLFVDDSIQAEYTYRKNDVSGEGETTVEQTDELSKEEKGKEVEGEVVEENAVEEDDEEFDDYDDFEDDDDFED